MVPITVAERASQDLKCLIPTVFRSEPTGAVGEEKEADEEDDCWDHLHAPGDSEGRRRLVGIVGTTSDLSTIFDLALVQETLWIVQLRGQ